MLRLLNRHRLLIAVLIASALIGAISAKLNTAGNLQVGAAATHLMVDYPGASIVNRRALPQDLATLQRRAELYGRLMVTTPVLDAIARRAGVPPGQVSGVARTTADVPIPLTEPGSEERASQIRASRAPYRLELQSSAGEPILAIYSKAPSAAEAQVLADSAVLGLKDYLGALARRQKLDPRRMPQLRQLGSARGGVTNGKAPIAIGALTFITAFALSFAGLTALLRRRLRRAGTDAPRSRPRDPLTGRPAADWPRTTRVLPWSVAAFIAMLWLTPFDKIQLSMSTPVDLTLDRLVLPVIAATWLIAFTAGAGVAPRLRITPVHAALGAFLACAFVSVVLDARYLNQTGELMLAFKKLPLLVSYFSIFVIVASSIRRSEVPAFMTYTLVLAVICALGVIYQYRSGENLFNTVSGHLFRGPFTLVLNGDGPGLDALGRRWVAGPAAYGVEAIAMMSMALPIAVMGMLRATPRKRVLYGLAIAVLFAAMFATERKSALVAPVAVMLTLAYFRRRELLSLAPVGLVIGVIVAAISPGAVQGVVAQFTRSNASQVATVSDRTADYDAVRPDVWTHLLFGRGFGSYNHDTYRILDSEILGRIVETGVVGLAAFALIALAVILHARGTVAERDPRWAPPALTGVAAGVALLVVATLYDVMAFPHAPMLFLCIAGLVVAVVGPPGEEAATPEVRAPTSRAGHVRSHQPAPSLRAPVRAG